MHARSIIKETSCCGITHGCLEDGRLGRLGRLGYDKLVYYQPCLGKAHPEVFTGTHGIFS